ncbi:MAG TPA: DUF2232 domain-containing protein [Gemmatimonadaceae bacterium]|nr:DUF2232 domain-containing protein [Gemmatimonadaceae bacterium]
MLLPLVPLLRVAIPIEQSLLLIVPALAASALVGWWAGGRFFLALSWTALAVWILVTPLPGSAGFVAAAKGWALLAAATFGVVSIMSPRQPFFPRALSAIGLSFAVGLALVLFAAKRPDSVERTVRAEYTRRVDSWLADWESLSKTKEWQQLTRDNPGMETLARESSDRLRQLPPVTARLYPAILALESLAVLALAWALFHRVSRARIGPPLAPLKEFRFNDQLVWGLVAGITAVAVPTLTAFRVAGLNLLVFFGALYALRGLGVLTWFFAPGRLMVALTIGLAIFMWPLLGVFALGIGLGDTWLDWRSRPRPTT